MTIDSICNGIVIDHIKAGKSMEIYQHLNLKTLTCCVAIIKNVPSKKMGRKDIIKIDSIIDLNLDVLGYIDPNATISIIENGQLKTKFHLSLPDNLTNVFICKNPRCITSIEQELPNIFTLTDEKKHIYRCIYCETQGSVFKE